MPYNYCPFLIYFLLERKAIGSQFNTQIAVRLKRVLRPLKRVLQSLNVTAFNAVGQNENEQK